MGHPAGQVLPGQGRQGRPALQGEQGLQGGAGVLGGGELHQAEPPGLTQKAHPVGDLLLRQEVGEGGEGVQKQVRVPAAAV